MIYWIFCSDVLDFLYFPCIAWGDDHGWSVKPRKKLATEFSPHSSNILVVWGSVGPIHVDMVFVCVSVSRGYTDNYAGAINRPLTPFVNVATTFKGTSRGLSGVFLPLVMNPLKTSQSLPHHLLPSWGWRGPLPYRSIGLWFSITDITHFV